MATGSSFSSVYTRGVGQAAYYAATTMTGVGCGDKVTKTVSGRLFTSFMAFSGLIFISCFTAEV